MKIKHIIISSALALIVATPFTAVADTSELGAPIVQLMPHFKEIRAQLNLNTDQNTTIDDWLAAAPAKRKAMENETIAVRQQLRDAILDGAPRIKREALKGQLAEKQTRLIEMRSLCTRMLRDTLNKEQFSKVVKNYRAG